MEILHQDSIRKNFTVLIAETNTNNLINNLQHKEVFTAGAIESLKTLDGQNQARKLYIDIQKRGSTAFEKLIKGLLETNQRPLALLLDPNKQFINDNQRTGGAVPFQFPEDIRHLNMQQLHPTWNVSSRMEPIQVEVQKSVDFSHDEVDANKAPIYYTRSKLRGMALVINMFHVRNYKPRRGSEHDVQNLKDLFKQIGMKVNAKVDLTKQEIMRELKDFVGNPELKRCDISVLVIMSHGGLSDNNEEYFLDTNEQRIYTKDVENLFSNSNSVYMQAKPKIVIYQICRGKLNDYGIIPGEYCNNENGMTNNNHNTESDGVILDSMPMITDLLIIHSTLKEYKTNRDIYTGAWFIQLLCEVFMHYAHSTHVEDMLKWIQSSLQLQRSFEGTMQTLEYTNRAFKLCYLNPGIYMEKGTICHYE